jgi:hypothetical protein
MGRISILAFGYWRASVRGNALHNLHHLILHVSDSLTTTCSVCHISLFGTCCCASVGVLPFDRCYTITICRSCCPFENVTIRFRIDLFSVGMAVEHDAHKLF